MTGDDHRRGRDGSARPDQRGQSTVELAMALPFIATLVMLVLQSAFVARDQVLVVHAARAAVREASVGADDERVTGAARRVVGDATVDIQRGREVGAEVRVRVVHRSVTDLPLVGPLLPDPTVTAEAVMRLEGAAP
ncbi:MAG TPA: TadE family protein [Acidimicrobiia bacterium]|nr:TadE family protein [Acidimicrobiia bacterium]